jgi:hypothetical protein
VVVVNHRRVNHRRVNKVNHNRVNQNSVRQNAENSQNNPAKEDYLAIAVPNNVPIKGASFEIAVPNAVAPKIFAVPIVRMKVAVNGTANVFTIANLTRDGY